MEFDTLGLNIKRNGETTILWELSNSQGNIWKQAFVDVPSGGGDYMVRVGINELNNLDFQLEFEGIASVAETGHTALDDLSYAAGESCGSSTGGVCDLQVGLCRWENAEGDDADWVVSRNGTGNPGSGPRYQLLSLICLWFILMLQCGPYLWDWVWKLPSSGHNADAGAADCPAEESSDTGTGQPCRRLLPVLVLPPLL
jgi:hypothetical protein